MHITKAAFLFKNFIWFIEAKHCRRLNIPSRSVLFPVIWITNKCNLRCRMCDQWKTPAEMASRELSTQEWFSFIDSAKLMHAAVIVITGGEPLLRPDIFEIIKYMRHKGISAHLCSNGTLINESVVAKLKDSNLNSISISLDSACAEEHNYLRGFDCFETVVRNIQMLKRKNSELNIGINCLITKINFRGISGMVAFAEGLGVQQIKFDLIHTNLMHRNKPISSFDGLLFNNEDLLELKREINKIKNLIPRKTLLINSRTFLKGIVDNDNNKKIKCHAGYISCAVDALGGVSPCDNFDRCISLREKPLEEIWHSYSFQELRKKVHNCNISCWDTTHAELNIRCSNWGFLKELPQITKEIHFYNSQSE